MKPDPDCEVDAIGSIAADSTSFSAKFVWSIKLDRFDTDLDLPPFPFLDFFFDLFNFTFKGPRFCFCFLPVGSAMLGAGFAQLVHGSIIFSQQTRGRWKFEIIVPGFPVQYRIGFSLTAESTQFVDMRLASFTPVHLPPHQSLMRSGFLPWCIVIQA